jgi:hypothetical protein
MAVKFPKAKVIHKKSAHEMHFIYNVGPNTLKKIEFTDGVWIWAAVEHAMQKMAKGKEC